MAKPFYTLGLPRTRSTWLTQLLRTRYADCYHDIYSVYGKLPVSSNQYAGSCDTMVFKPEDRSPVLIVQRDKAEVIEEFISAFDNPFDKPFRLFVEGFIGKIQSEIEKCDGLKVNTEDLDDYKNITDIIRYLKPEEKQDEYHIRAMLGTHITMKTRDIKLGLEFIARFRYRTDLKGLYTIFTGETCQVG